MIDRKMGSLLKEYFSQVLLSQYSAYGIRREWDAEEKWVHG